MTARAGAREGLSDRVSSAVVATEPPTLLTQIDRQRAEVERALPVHLKANAEQYVRAALTLVKQTPGLMQCDPKTILGGLMTASQLGLEFGPLGHAYLVPFNNRRTGNKEAQFIIGYKGLIDLCWRSGQLASISAREVCEGDEFDFDYGLADSLHHKPNLEVDRSRPYAWYGVAKFTNGGHYFLVVGKPEIEQHRAKSLAKDTGPWKTDYNAMARKTVVRMMQPFLPLSSEVARELARDETVSRGMTVDELEVEPVDYIEAEVVDGELEVSLAEEGFDFPVIYDPTDDSMRPCVKTAGCIFADGHSGDCDLPNEEN